MVRKALGVVEDGLEDYGDLLIGRAEAKRMLRTHENVNVNDILRAHEVPESGHDVADPPKLRGSSGKR